MLHSRVVVRCTYYTFAKQKAVSYKNITPQMSAFGTFPYYAPPRGLVNTVGRCPTPHVRHVAGVQGESLLHPYHEALGRLQPVKAKPLRGLLRKP